ncbi:serine hydrolase domain-containing protein [Algoriphagus sediminis]|uniref:Serine hydrolase domain-containing protein n=1 Tax=Algoriphagus sediminis TaxID=3057113 RepID=A0ABT7YBP0_9BACT|nr:serine hydrolase domain-containing protein [Algoriphagus sediminis]MDN3203946.1 serine hydrolase domain-containing protein [Algoriphagus sediminis]
MVLNRSGILYLGVLTLFLSACNEPVNQNFIVNEEVKSRIDSTLQSYVNTGNVGGVSALIFENDKEVYFNAFGFADRENQKPMDRETLVRIYSMTKPITGTALMQLWENGKFDLDDPLEKYAPEFSGMKVYEGVDENGEMILVDADRPISIRDITRHTAGFPNRNDIPGLSEIMAEVDARSFENTLTVMAEKMGRTPLWFHPGTQWEYGLSVDVQAFLVERISGQPYGEYLRANVLDPLGLDETKYYLPEDERDRLAVAYTRTGEGQLEPTPDSIANRFNFNKWPLTPGGFGLVSTIDDYMTFARMLARKGEINGTRILEPETIELMATNHLPDSITERSWLPSKGRVGFGIDFAVRTEAPQRAEEINGIPGEFFWDGAASTLFWVDPKNDLVAVLFVQLFPYDGIGLHKNFKDAVYGKFVPEE